MAMKLKKGIRFTTYEAPNLSPFEKLFEIFQEIITHTSGDFDEAIEWLSQLDEEYKLTDEEYTIDDFIEDLKNKGYIREEFEDGDAQIGENGDTSEEGDGKGGKINITAKLEQMLRKRALDQIFGKIKRSGSGNHKTGKTLDILVFGNDAWPISIKELPYLKVGPYHTNTVAGLQLAMDMLRRKRNTNKQIFMITDGKPSCLRLPNGDYYKNSVGLDEHIVEKCYNMASQARKLHIPITTFMIAQDPYLMQFIREFTEANRGKAFYTGLKGLGEMIFEDYENNRKKRIK